MLFNHTPCKIIKQWQLRLLSFWALPGLGGIVNESNVESLLIARLAASRDSTPEEVMLDLERTGAIDSLEGVELVIEAEQTFGIAVSDKELSSEVCQSIPKLVALILSKLDPSREVRGGSCR